MSFPRTLFLSLFVALISLALLSHTQQTGKCSNPKHPPAVQQRTGRQYLKPHQFIARNNQTLHPIRKFTCVRSTKQSHPKIGVSRCHQSKFLVFTRRAKRRLEKKQRAKRARERCVYNTQSHIFTAYLCHTHAQHSRTK